MTKDGRGFFQFDHSDVAAWPEYQAVVDALNDFAHRCEKDEAGLKQPDFERMLAAVARHLIAGDCCERCMDYAYDHRSELTDEEQRQLHRPWIPFRNGASDGKVEGVYRCDRGHTWRCWYATRDLVVQLP